MKLYVEGFRGPWGWVNDFYGSIRLASHGVECVYRPEDADVIFQCDPQNWRYNSQFLGKKKVIANVLDYAHWIEGGNPDTEEYTKEFVTKADLACGICQDVLDMMEARGVKSPRMFYYPSQILGSDLDYRFPTRKKTFLSIGRFGDPGKRIQFPIGEFERSGLAAQGWKYLLIGPEPPNCVLPKGVSYLGYMERSPLINFIKSSHCVIQPEPETGLGLPSIESALLETPFLAHNSSPMTQIWDTAREFLFDDKTLAESMVGITDIDQYTACLGRANLAAQPWLRETAFESLRRMCLEV